MSPARSVALKCYLGLAVIFSIWGVYTFLDRASDETVCFYSTALVYVVPKLEDILPKAQKGDAKAQTDMGKYYLGNDTFPRYHRVSPDYKQAVTWFLRAANQGYTDAEYNLARLYFEGKGITRNLKEAYRLLLYASKKTNGCDVIHLTRKVQKELWFWERNEIETRAMHWQPTVEKQQ